MSTHPSIKQRVAHESQSTMSSILMDAEGFQRAESLFHEALSLPREARGPFIEREAKGDERLARRVHRLVERADSYRVTLDQPHLIFDNGESVDHDFDSLVGAVIGPYHVLELLGSGGFGRVYRAEQLQPIQRFVALKILHAGMDSRQVVARFEVEQQSLALMQHPNIARVFDAGRTAESQGSRPYIAMEYIQGRSITEYCDARALTLDERLLLFIDVCLAVQHAHQKGVIHRDLKPSNILVHELDGEAEPKVIDFGIAKAIQQPRSDLPVTEAAQLLGTPQYMSPEQTSPDAGAIDTRSDIYALGVILYELLTGTTPIDAEALQEATYGRVLDLIRSRTIERPSSRLRKLSPEHVTNTSTPRDRSLLAAIAPRRLRGDLDWITLKTLDSDRERRYHSATALAEDIRRHLNNEPVVAGPPGAAYRAKKFVQRHRTGVAAATLIALTVLVGVVVSVAAMMRVSESASQAQAINRFMREVLTSVDPVNRGANVRLAEVLDTASRNASVRFRGHPELEAQLREMLGEVYDNLSMWTPALTEYRRAEEIWLGLAGEDDARTLEVQMMIGAVLGSAGRNREALAQVERILPSIQTIVGADSVLAFRTERLQGLALTFLRRPDEGERVLRDALDRARRTGAPDETVMELIDMLAKNLDFQLTWAQPSEELQLALEIESLCRTLIDDLDRMSGPDSPSSMFPRLLRARAQLVRGDANSAAHECQTLLKMSDERLGECHSVRSQIKSVLAQAVYLLGRDAEAASLRLRQIECKRTEAADNTVVLVSTMYESMPFLDHGGRWQEGESIAREVVEILRGFGGGHGATLIGAESHLARFVSLQGRLDEAEQLFDALRPRWREGDTDVLVAARLHLHYGCHLTKRSRFEDAEQHLFNARELLGETPGTWPSPPDDVARGFIALYEACGRPEKAREYEEIRRILLSKVHN